MVPRNKGFTVYNWRARLASLVFHRPGRQTLRAPSTKRREVLGWVGWGGYASWIARAILDHAI